ncbi:MAG: PIN domain-containing protein [Nanoarchaeota archaeon]
MKIVIDVNILISVLLKDSKTRSIIKNSDLNFYFPEIAFHKIIKYKNYMIEKAQITEEDFILLLAKLFSHIKLISRREMLEQKIKAKELMKTIDEEDYPFVAAALSLGNDGVIWSEDKHFEKQNLVKVIKTTSIDKFVS